MDEVKPRTNQRRGVNWGLLVVGAALLSLLGLDFFFRPAIENMTAHTVQVFAMRCINDAMTAELEDQGVGYNEIVTVVQNSAGNVTSIQSNMVEINRLKSRVTGRVIDTLSTKENRSIIIRGGSLLGSQLFAGQGPEIQIRLEPAGHMTTQLYNEFTSAGINQTLHRVMLEVGVEIDAIFPGYIVKTETVTNYCIAETVIVGEIPEGYVQITGLDTAAFGHMQ